MLRSPAPVSVDPTTSLLVEASAATGAAESVTLNALLNAQKQVCFDAKKIVFQQEDPAENVFLIASGVVRLYRFLPSGRRLIWRFLFAGDMVGLEFDKDYPVSAECITPVTAYQLSRLKFLSLTAYSPALNSDMVRALKAELATEHEEHLPLMHQQAEARVVRFLRMFIRRNGGECGTGAQIQLSMPRPDIADYLGLTNETVSRCFKKMKKDGVLSEPLPNQIRVENARRLASLANDEQV